MKTRSRTEACRAWRARLLAALEAEQAGTPDPAAAAVAAHLEHCPGCASEAAALRRTLARLAEYRPAEAPAAYWPALRSQVLRSLVSESESAPRRAPLLPRLAWGGLAAAGLLLLALSFWNERQAEPGGIGDQRLAIVPTALQTLDAELMANAGRLDQLLAEGQVDLADEDPDLMLEELTTAELAELAERLDGLRG